MISIAPLVQVDLAFVVDVTGSMKPYLHVIRGYIQEILAEVGGKIKDKIKNINIELRCAVVPYRDIGEACPAPLPLTTDVAVVTAYLATLHGEGGGDIPEHVVGGLEAAIRELDAPSKCAEDRRSKFIILITDAPQHGKACNDKFDDSYKAYGEDGRHPTMDAVMRIIAEKDIGFIFGTICQSATAAMENHMLQSHREQRRAKGDGAKKCTAIQAKFLDVPDAQQKYHFIFAFDDSGSMMIPMHSDASRFYNTHILGQTTFRVDGVGNPQGAQYNLGKARAFAGKRLVIGDMYGCSDRAYIENEIGAAGLGFTLEWHTTEAPFIAALARADVAWLISNNTMRDGTTSQALATACLDFHKGKGDVKGKGLLIMGDNDPYYLHANIILPALTDNPAFQLTGNLMCNQILSAGDANTRQQFGMHLVVSGLQRIYEGVTICYPTLSPAELARHRFKVIGTNSDVAAKPVLLAADGVITGYMETTEVKRGRLVIDNGFTKLLAGYINRTEGTVRYMGNATAWLMYQEAGHTRWDGLMKAFDTFVKCRLGSQLDHGDTVSIVYHDDTSKLVLRNEPLSSLGGRYPHECFTNPPAPHPPNLPRFGTNNFYVALSQVEPLVRDTPRDTIPVLVFMSDGGDCGNRQQAYLKMEELKAQYPRLQVTTVLAYDDEGSLWRCYPKATKDQVSMLLFTLNVGAWEVGDTDVFVPYDALEEVMPIPLRLGLPSHQGQHG